MLAILHNPRYAGLVSHKGEIVGEGQWPAYITVRQHHRIQQLIADRLRERRKQPHNEAFLLSCLARCGICGRALVCHTAGLREDGTFRRRYVCDSHWHDTPSIRCPARRIDADVLEAMLASVVAKLLPSADEQNVLPDLIEAFDGHWSQAPERRALREAARSHDDALLDLSIERMVARVAPELAVHRQVAATRRHSRHESLVRRLHEWGQAQWLAATAERRRQTLDLNVELRELFAAVHVHDAVRETVITAQLRHTPTDGWSPAPLEVRIDRRAWARGAGHRQRPQATWSNEEIIAALQEWAAAHGRPPNASEWLAGSPDRPGSLCVRRRFGSWERALRKAGIKPNHRRQGRYWSDVEMIHALKSWTNLNGRLPRAGDWKRARKSHPCSRSVSQRFGSFGAAVAAAGLVPAAREES